MSVSNREIKPQGTKLRYMAHRPFLRHHVVAVDTANLREEEEKEEEEKDASSLKRTILVEGREAAGGGGGGGGSTELEGAMTEETAGEGAGRGRRTIAMDDDDDDGRDFNSMREDCFVEIGFDWKKDLDRSSFSWVSELSASTSSKNGPQDRVYCGVWDLSEAEAPPPPPPSSSSSSWLALVLRVLLPCRLELNLEAAELRP